MTPALARGGAFEISVSTGPLDEPGSLVRVRLSPAGSARALADHLNSLEPGAVEQHWTLATFQGNYRNQRNWESACGLALDFDYWDAAGKHVALPEDVRDQLIDATADGTIAGNVLHLTPRGCRVVVLFPNAVSSSAGRVILAAGAATLVAESLATLGVGPGAHGGLREDEPKTRDCAAAMFCPRASVEGVVRDARALVLREEAYSFTALREAAERRVRPPSAAKGRAAPAPSAAPSSTTVEEAVARFNSEHRMEFPASGGTCPACGHKDCFGQVPDSGGKWSCFSSSHETDSGGCGRPAPSGDCWWGDVLDLEAHRAGHSRVEHLRCLRYLDERRRAERSRPRADASEAGDLVVVRVADVEREHVTWLWTGYLPYGKLVVLDGDPGLGKSTLLLDVAARLSRGLAMPLGQAPTAVADSLILSAEDGIGDTIRPRLEAAGADLTRVHVVMGVREGTDERPFQMPLDVLRLEVLIRRKGARLVVIDPLFAHLDDETDSHRDQDVRRVLRALGDVAQRTGACVVVLRHLNKMSGPSALYRGGGSIGIVGAARVGLLVGRDPDDRELRVLAITKSNLARAAESIAFRLEDATEHDVARIAWVGVSERCADDLVGRAAKSGGARDAAEEFLRAFLAEGPRLASEGYAEAAKQSISERTLKRAKRTLKVEAFRKEVRGKWWWRLPGTDGEGGADPDASKPPAARGPVQMALFGKGAPVEPESAQGGHARTNSMVGPLGRIPPLSSAGATSGNGVEGGHKGAKDAKGATSASAAGLAPLDPPELSAEPHDGGVAKGANGAPVVVDPADQPICGDCGADLREGEMCPCTG